MNATLAALAVVAAVLPFLPLRLVSNESLARARDFWLLLMLAVGTVWAAIVIPPFAPIGLYFLWWWRAKAQLPSLVTWCVIGIFFFGVGRLPALWLEWIPLAWLAAGTAGVVPLARQWWQLRPEGSPWWNPYRPFHGAAWWGQRTVAACVYALLVPFWWPWGLLVALPGLAITSSWAAWLAALVAVCVMEPVVFSVVLWAGGFLLATAGLLRGIEWARHTRLRARNAENLDGHICLTNQSDTSAYAAGVARVPLGENRLSGQPKPAAPPESSPLELWSLLNWRRWLEYTPRGDSLDSLWQRIRVARLLVYAWTNPAWWPMGFGPRSMERGVMRWASKIGPEKIPLGQVHNELLHFCYEYGPPGLVGLFLLAAKLSFRLHWGDPWTACLAAGAILMTASIPGRYVGSGLIWLTAAAVVYWR